MIVERAERLRELVNSYKDAAGAATEAQKLGNTLQAVQDAVTALERSQPVLRVLSGLSLADEGPSLSACQDLVLKAKDAVDGSARSFADTEDCARLLSVLKVTADQVGAHAIQGWQDFCTSNQQSLPADLLSALSVVAAYRDTAERAQGAADRLRSVIASSGPIPTSAQVEAAVRAQEELAAALDAIQQSVPAEVQAASATLHVPRRPAAERGHGRIPSMDANLQGREVVRRPH